MRLDNHPADRFMSHDVRVIADTTRRWTPGEVIPIALTCTCGWGAHLGQMPKPDDALRRALIHSCDRKNQEVSA